VFGHKHHLLSLFSPSVQHLTPTYYIVNANGTTVSHFIFPWWAVNIFSLSLFVV
jgi:hypothetical protein